MKFVPRKNLEMIFMSLKEKLGTSARFNSVTLSIKIRVEGAGLSAQQIQDVLERVAKSAVGKARYRHAHAWCDDLRADCALWHSS